MSGIRKLFSLIRAALSTCAGAKKQVPTSVQNKEQVRWGGEEGSTNNTRQL